MVGSVNRQTGYRDPASVSIANMETTNDQRRSSGFRDALCGGLGRAGRQHVYPRYDSSRLVDDVKQLYLNELAARGRALPQIGVPA